MARTTKYAWALKHYTDAGWRVGVVERTYKIDGRAQTFDLFTFGDMYGYRLQEHVIIQVTTDRDHAGHAKSMLANPDVEKYLRASPRNHVHLISEHRDKRSPGKLGQVRVQIFKASNFG